MSARVLALLMSITGLIGVLTGPPTPASAASPISYKMATFNSQGAKWDQIRVIVNAGNDIVFVQEAGAEPSANGMELLQIHGHGNQAVREYRWNDRYVYWINPMGGTGGRVTLATVTRQRAAEVFVAPPGRDGGRSAMGVRFDNDIYYNVHAQATGTRNEARELVANIRDQAATSHREWTAVGDFNRDPNEGMHDLANSMSAFVYHTGEATQSSGGELDYMISSHAIAGYQASRQGGRGSDHFPVYFEHHLAANGAVVNLISDNDHEKFIGFEGRSSANNTRVVSESYDANGSKWTLEHAAGFGSQSFFIRNNLTNKCMDTISGNLVEWDCVGQKSAIFLLNTWDEEPGTYKLFNINYGLCVDTMGSNPKHLGLYKCTPKSPNQRFIPHFY
ncbi:endonuclease/exonuclease/phosphatase family protein [Kitasatospora sp. NPDC005748]|uniref:endonuclease/exonuclease/phosphatase family protein n=1 Tax=Kitasatospora sp. NPDC005748 TaxID=3157063 RepID=UPI0033DB4F13